MRPTLQNSFFIGYAFTILAFCSDAAFAAPIPPTENLVLECAKTAPISRVRIHSRICFAASEDCKAVLANYEKPWPATAQPLFPSSYTYYTAEPKQVSCKTCNVPKDTAAGVKAGDYPCELQLGISDKPGLGGLFEDIAYGYSRYLNYWLSTNATCSEEKVFDAATYQRQNPRGVDRFVVDDRKRDGMITAYCLPITTEFSGVAYCHKVYQCATAEAAAKVE